MGHVVQRRVGVVEGRRVVLFLDVDWMQRVGQAGRKHRSQSEWRSEREITTVDLFGDAVKWQQKLPSLAQELLSPSCTVGFHV